MIKKLLFSALIFSGIIAGAQTFTATYSFAATTSLTGTTDPSTPPVVTGLTCGSFMAVGTPTNPNATARFSFTNWPTGSATGTVSTDTYTNMTGSINTNEYYEVVLTPQSGYTVAFNTIAFTVQRSGTGIRNYVVRTSADGFTNNLPASVSTGTNLSVVGTNIFFWNLDAVTSAQNGSTISLLGATATSSVSFRFYAWNSEATTGTFSIDNVSFTGTVTGAAAPCNSPTIALISNNSPVCANQQMNLQSTLLGDAPFTYTWTGAGSFGSANSASTTVTNPSSGDYTLTVMNACGTASAVTTATVYSLPVVAVNSETICAGNSAALTATGTATSYSWSTSEFGTSIIVSPSSFATYTVTGTDANACTNMAVAYVAVNNLPTLSVNSPSICSGNSATLTVSGADTYTWSTAENGASIVITPTASATYTVSGTDVNGCMNMTTSSVTFNNLPVVLIDYSGPSTMECENSIDTLIATGANNYVWSSSETNDTLIVTHLIGGTTSWTVVGTDLNGCMDTDTYSFTGITPADVVSVDLSAISLLCVTNGTVTLATATPTNGVWSGTGVTADTFDPSVAGVGTFTITYTSTGACPGSDSDVITVDACTGIQALTNNSFNLYPNPSNGFVTIHSASFPATLNVFDINGRQVYSQTITTSETVVDLSEIANGVYQLNIKTEQNSFNQKVMINK